MEMIFPMTYCSVCDVGLYMPARVPCPRCREGTMQARKAREGRSGIIKSRNPLSNDAYITTITTPPRVAKRCGHHRPPGQLPPSWPINQLEEKPTPVIVPDVKIPLEDHRRIELP